MKNDTVTRGTVTVKVSGEQDGRAKTLSMDELTDRKDASIPFKLKHFQRLEGRLVLPENFRPRRASVAVTPRGKPKSRVEKTFDWPEPVG
jgi:hypothetical protein